jgi:hypothetical protein
MDWLIPVLICVETFEGGGTHEVFTKGETTKDVLSGEG